VGTAIGLAGSFALLKVLNQKVSIIPGDDPRVLVGAAAFLAIVALLACWLPARRATKVDPLVALRTE
jgi:putative ABC transport system permease protein